MTLTEYVNQRKQELDSFANYWMLQSKDDPENWPVFMNRVDWDEQEQMIVLEEGL